jgi:hypothetical protein
MLSKFAFFPPRLAVVSQLARSNRRPPVELALLYGKPFPAFAARISLRELERGGKSFSTKLMHALLLVTSEATRLAAHVGKTFS